MARTFRLERHHSEIVSKGTVFKVLKYLDKHKPETPVLLMDEDKIVEKARLIGSGIRNCKVFYAFKANPHPDVSRLMHKMGLGFEIASDGELAVLRDIGVPADKIITSNPVKTMKFLRAAAEYGVEYYSFDSTEEVEKMAKYVPKAKLYVRLSVPNEGSDWPLSKKFGVQMDEAEKLLLLAADRGLNPVGITFHVGSQCLNKYSWNSALYMARELWERVDKRGLRLKMLNIGGGYPINYTKNVVGVEAIEKNIDSLIKENFPEDTEIFIEPGRAMVGDAGVFVSTVVGKARRQGDTWVSIDVGVFNGMMESVGGIKYTYVVEETPGLKSTKHHMVICGPSCDSFDVIDLEVRLQEPEVGSLMLILSAGAYTTSYASEFNGFSIPKTIIV